MQAALNKVYNEIRKEQIKVEIGETIDVIYTNTTWNLTGTEWGLPTVLSTNKSVLVHLYNPGPKGNYSIRLKTDERELNIVSSANTNIAGDLICSNVKDSKDCDLFFVVPFEETSSNYVKLVPVKSGGSAKITKLKDIGVLESTRDFNISSTASLKFTKANQKFDLTIPSGLFTFYVGYNYYEAYMGDGQNSGAYIFRPSNLTKTAPRKYSTIKTVHYAEGTTTTVIVLEGDHTYSKIYLDKESGYVDTYGFEIETYIPTIDIADKVGK